MAKRPTRLTRVTDELTRSATADRRREQIDEAIAGGPGSTEQQAAEGTGTDGLDTGATGKPGSGLEGSAFDFLDAAVSGREGERQPDDGAAEPGQPTLEGNVREARLGGGGADEAATSSGAGSDGSFVAEQIAARTFTPDFNPNPGVSDAPANPLADVAASGLRGTGSLTTPKADGVSAGPSVENAGVDAAFNRRLAEAAGEAADVTADFGVDGTRSSGKEDGSTLKVGSDFFTVDTGSSTRSVSKTDDTLTLHFQSDGFVSTEVQTIDENGNIVKVTSTTEVVNPNGTVTTTTDVENEDGSTTTTTTTTAPEPSAEVPADDIDGPSFVDRTGASPTGTGGQGGDVDPGDDPVFEVAPGTPLPDLQDRLLGGDGVEPDFGGGAAGPSNPGADSQGAGSITPTDDAADPLGSGPEDDPFAGGTQPLEPGAAEDDAEPVEPVTLLRSVVDQSPDLGPDLDRIQLDDD